MRRVLIISYYWPPAGGSGVQRWVKFSKYLPSEGWQPVVYTPENPELSATDDTLAGEIPPEAEILKRKIFEPYGIYRKLSGKKSTRVGSSEVRGGKMSISKFIRGNFFIPDPRCFWIGPSVRFLKKYLEENPVDAIVSTGPPHSMHLIARKVAKATGTPWAADFRDPWTRMFFFKHLGLTKFSAALHRALERKVLRDADVIVAVSPAVKKEFETMTSTPVALITNGFDRGDFPEAEPDGYFNVVHTGLMTSDGNPEVLWRVLAEKAAAEPEFRGKLRVRLAGNTDTAVLKSMEACGLGGFIVNRGYIAHKEASREQVNATLLILPIRREPESKSILPGKLFEYLAASRPVLAIDDPEGATAAVLSETGAGKTFDWEDRDGMKAWLDESWEAFLAGGIKYDQSNIDQYSRPVLSSKMARLLESISKK